MDLTNEDVADILALLDSLPYDELDLQTPRFRLTLRRTPDGWTQAVETRVAPTVADVALPGGALQTTAAMEHRCRPGGTDVPSVSSGAELVAVRAPLPGTFYRAPRPGTAPFVEVGSRVGADTVVGIVETMKLFNSVSAGTAGTVAEICLGNGEFADRGATLLSIRAD
jgi:acetyl-CoA carboxylase biotin carboxyl carrier protein